MAIAGKVGFVGKGLWNSSTSYEKLNVVRVANGSSYFAKQNNVGQDPTLDATETYWQLLAESDTAIFQDQIDDIVDGVTRVGNSDKLDGLDSTDFERTLLSSKSGQLVTLNPSYDGACEVSGLVHNELKTKDGTITVNGITYTVSDNVVVGNGTANSAGGRFAFEPIFPLIELKAGKKYTVSAHGTIKNVTMCITDISYPYDVIDSSTINFTFVPSSDMSILFGLNVITGEDVNVNAKFSIIEGEEEVPYVPYTYKVKSCGKNLAHAIENYNFSMYYGISASSEVGESEFVINGTSTEDLAFRIMEFTLPQGTYTASVHGLNNNGVTRLYLENTDGNTVIINNIMPNAQRKFTISEETTIVVHCVLSNNDTYVNKTICVQVEPGTEATDYEPYTEDTATVTPSTDKLYLKTYDGTTNIFTDYSIEIDVSYGATENGAKLLKADEISQNGADTVKLNGSGTSLSFGVDDYGIYVEY